jgi:carboxylesterase type B
LSAWWHLFLAFQINVFLLLVVWSSKSIQAQNAVELITQLGNITGFTDFRNTRIFYNIPYGKSPTGSRRFAKPEPFGKWTETRSAMKPPPMCLQPKSPMNDALGLTIEEDCLTLNIYTPVSVEETLPVMVWIHGGGYVGGGAVTYDGSGLAKVGNVVVVTINYRLGLDGFLSFGDSIVKGNFGIWDQILALRWVKDNIIDYGGNPNEVTIFGESAGGMSVSLLTLIPSNRGLFKRAIMQSGVANSLFAFQYGPPESHRATAELLGCPYSEMNPRTTLECLHQINISAILNVTTAIAVESSSARLMIGPVVDGELFKRPIAEIFADDKSEELNFFRSLDVMVGTTDSDGSFLLRLGATFQKEYGYNISNEGLPRNVFCDVIIPSLSADYYRGNSEVSSALCERYGRANDQAENSRQAVKMLGDIFFLSPAVKTLSVHAQNNEIAKSYQYVFSEWSLPFFFDADVFPPWFEGAGHATELIYLFFLESLSLVKPNINVTATDYELATKMRAQWTNFSKYG